MYGISTVTSAKTVQNTYVDPILKIPKDISLVHDIRSEGTYPIIHRQGRTSRKVYFVKLERGCNNGNSLVRLRTTNSRHGLQVQIRAFWRDMDTTCDPRTMFGKNERLKLGQKKNGRLLAENAFASGLVRKWVGTDCKCKHSLNSYENVSIDFWIVWVGEHTRRPLHEVRCQKWFTHVERVYLPV